MVTPPLADRSRLGAAYGWLWSPSALSNLADGVLKVGLPLVAIRYTNGRLHAAELTANQFVGPPLAGFLVVAGAAVALAGPAALWAVAVAALLPVRGRFRIERDQRTTIRADIAEGLRFLMRHGCCAPWRSWSAARTSPRTPRSPSWCSTRSARTPRSG